MSSLPNMDYTDLLITPQCHKEMMMVLVDEIVTPTKESGLTEEELDAAFDGDNNNDNEDIDKVLGSMEDDDCDNKNIDPSTQVLVEKLKVLFLAVNFMLKKTATLEAELGVAKKER